MSAPLQTNFAYLQSHDAQLVRLGILAERYFPEDPNTSLLKLRQLAELLAQLVATRVGLYVSNEEPQYQLIRRLQDHGIVPREVAQLFDEVRRAGNAANHSLTGDHRMALVALKLSRQLGLWFHPTFGDSGFKSGPFLPPQPPIDDGTELRKELDRLARELAEYQMAHRGTAEKLQLVEQELRHALDERAFWEAMAVEADRGRAEVAARLAKEQARTEAAPAATGGLVSAANAAVSSLELDEAETRELIDQALRQAGWAADSAQLTYANGARPEKGKNLAIAEWPTGNGPADYVLFAGLIPIGAVEAKRKAKDVSGSLQQAKRYSRGFATPGNGPITGAPWGEFQLPCRRTGQLGFDLMNFVPILFSWPSRGTVVDYIADSTAVRWSAPHLTTFITLLLQTKVKVLHLIGHSMGTQALLDTISQLADVRVREVVLAAADIDRRIFEEQIAPALAGFSCRTTIYASAADEALRLSTTLNHGYERLGDCRDAVCVVPGVDSIDVSGVAKGILKHSTVFDVRTMVEDLHRLLQSSPIESRGLWERRNASGRYWVVPP